MLKEKKQKSWFKALWGALEHLFRPLYAILCHFKTFSVLISVNVKLWHAHTEVPEQKLAKQARRPLSPAEDTVVAFVYKGRGLVFLTTMSLEC